MKKFNLDLSKPWHYRLLIFFSVLASLAILGMSFRVIASIRLYFQTNQDAIKTVAIIQAKPAPAQEEVILPGNVQAWHEATIYARTNGYVQEWKTDIGSRVKAGELLAEIETPELNASLRQAEADLNTAIANNQLAQTTATRWKVLLKTDSVSKQDADEKIANAEAKLALVNSARANRDRLSEMVSFEKVIAPFDGIITSRTTDIGSLITEGSTTEHPLFHIVQADKLRIYVEIPQAYSSRISPDMQVKLYFSEHPGKSYAAKLFQTANAINPVSRTLLAQFVTDNSRYELLPGGYTQVHLIFPAMKGSVILPVNSLLFRAEGLQVAMLDAEDKIHLQSITIARDFGDQVEVDSGVKSGDRIIINPSDSLVSGQPVRVVSGNMPAKEKTS